jgi:hypothetical protein
MSYLDLILEYPGWTKMASSVLTKEAISKQEAKDVFNYLKGVAGRHWSANKKDYLTKGIGAAAGAAAGYGVSKKWKGKPSIEQRTADAGLKALKRHTKKKEEKGKKIGFPTDAASVVARTYKDSANLMAKYPVAGGGTQGALIGAGSAIRVRDAIKHIWG